MSDFVQTMKDWRRMCVYYTEKSGNNSCDVCPLDGCNAIYEDDRRMDYADIEEKVSSWAAEHPEPVYPTWGEWLVGQGVITTVPSIRYDEDGGFMYTPLPIIRDRIPTDIAEKLGLKPTK